MKAALGGTLQLLVAYLAFISIGLPDSVAGVAWPSVRNDFALNQSSLGLVFIGLSTGYFLSSFFGGWLTQRLGLGRLLTISSLLVAAAMFSNSVTPAWALFVIAAAVWGLGSGAIDAGLNAFVASRFSTRHVNWLHASYSLGATIGPVLMTAALVQADSWRAGYALVGALLLAMAILFQFTRRQWDDPAATDPAKSSTHVRLLTVLRQPLVMLHTTAFFLYTGLEFTVGQWSYTLLSESRHFPEATAGLLAASYFGAIGVGRVFFGVIADRIGVDRLLRFAMLMALGGTVLFAWPTFISTVLGLFLIGLGLAPVFPCLMARTPDRLGAEHAVHAIGFQVSAAMLGAAIAPGIAGLLAEVRIEFVAAFSILLAASLLATHEVVLFCSRRQKLS